MENFKDLTYNSAGPTVLIHGISLYASKGTLWSRTPIGKKITVSVSEMLPVIKITSEVLETLWIAGLQHSSRSTLGGFLIGYKHFSADFLNINIKEVQWHVRKTPRSSGDYAIRVFPKDFERGDITKRECEFMLQSTIFKLDSYAELEFLEPLDLCKTSLNFDVKGNEIGINCQMLFPSLDLEFVPISPLKIVSTALSLQLTQKNVKNQKFQTGFLTLDQKKRVLPLLCSDPLAFKYPLVGVWAIGCPGKQESPLSHPLIWASCIRFIESKLIQERISPNPDNNTFLFVYFSPRPQFYEASTNKKAAWCIQNLNYQLQKEGKIFNSITCRFLQEESPRISLNSPKLKQKIIKKTNLLENSNISNEGFSNIETMPRSVRSSLETCNGIAQSTERLIREQSEMLKRLEKQIQNLQSHVISSRLETPRKYEEFSPKMVSTATNTTLSTDAKIITPEIIDTKKSASTNTSFLISRSERKLPPRSKLSSENLDCKKAKSPTRAPSLRYSCSSTDISNIRSSINSNTSFQKSENSDTTIKIPKIIYESSLSDVSDEEIAELEKKYLK